MICPPSRLAVIFVSAPCLRASGVIPGSSPGRRNINFRHLRTPVETQKTNKSNANLFRCFMVVHPRAGSGSAWAPGALEPWAVALPRFGFDGRRIRCPVQRGSWKMRRLSPLCCGRQSRGWCWSYPRCATRRMPDEAAGGSHPRDRHLPASCLRAAGRVTAPALAAPYRAAPLCA